MLSNGDYSIYHAIEIQKMNLNAFLLGGCVLLKYYYYKVSGRNAYLKNNL